MRLRPIETPGIDAWIRIVCWSALLGVPLAYALYTNHVWEDFFITFRHSRNLVEGHGLVYQPGERVHGFTSPLNVLVPALGYWLTGASSFLPALWVYRLLSIAALAVGAAVLVRALAAQPGTLRVAALFLPLYLALEPKIVMFTVNGQEAGLMLLFLLPAAVWIAADPVRRWKGLGVCWAGLMWTRPDGCVYVAALGAVALAFTSGERRAVLGALLRAAALCAALYLPWFAWAWWYYGSPVPHTVLAKAALNAGSTHGVMAAFGEMLVKFPFAAKLAFEPTNALFGGWPRWTTYFAWVIAAFGTMYWLAPWADPLGRRLSALFVLVVLYLAYLAHAGGVFAWYTPPAAALGLATVAAGVPATVARFVADRRAARAVSTTVLACVLGTLAVVFGMSAQQMRVQQQVIEFGHRARIGEWLRQEVAPHERVFLEPLGYIGYFSGARMLDYPGLASPQVTRLLGDGLSVAAVVARLQPEWLVLRPREAENLLAHAALRARYRPVRVFDARAAIEARGGVAGLGYLRRDAVFIVFRRS